MPYFIGILGGHQEGVGGISKLTAGGRCPYQPGLSSTQKKRRVFTSTKFVLSVFTDGCVHNLGCAQPLRLDDPFFEMFGAIH